MSRKKIALMFVLCFGLCKLIAQPETSNLRLQRYTTKDGLSNNHVLKVCQDGKGFLWIATIDGLNRYDGNHFEKFFPDPKNPNRSAPGFVVRDLKVYKNFILIGSNTGMGVFNITTNRFENERILYPECNISKARICNNILPLPNGDFYLNIEGKPFLLDSMFRLKIDFSATNQINKDPIYTFGEPFLVNKHLLYIPNYAGLFLYDLNTRTFKKCEVKNYLDKVSLTSQLTLGLYGMAYSSNQILLSCYSKMPMLFSYAENNPATITYQKTIPDIANNKSIPSIIKRADHQLWAATVRGVLKFNFDNNNSNLYSLALPGEDAAGANVANNLFEDIQQNLWVSTNNGLVKTGNAHKRFKYLDDEFISGNKLNAASYNVLINQHSELIAYTANSDDSVLYVISNEGTQKTLTKKPIHIGTGILNLAQITDSTYYLCTWLGGYVYNFYTQKSVLPWFIPDSINTILSASFFKDSRNNFWSGIGAGKGMVHVWSAEHRYDYFNHYDFPAGHPNYLPIRYPTVFAEDNNGNIWFAMTRHESKLIKYSYTTNKFYEVHAVNCKNNIEPCNGAIGDMWLDKNNVLWLAKVDDGLIKYDISKNTCRQFTRSDGLCSNYLASLKPDNKGNIWIATASGLSCFNPVTETFKNFYEEDGLFENEITGNLSFDAKNNIMYVSGASKIFSFNPDSLYENKTPPLPYILYIHAGDSLILPADKNIFSYDKNNFEFTFTAVNLTDGLGNKYFYKLDGVDKTWKDAGDNKQVSYASINAGDYVFNVMAKNKSGVWSVQPATFSFTIEKPFWETLWFRFLLLAAIVSIIFVIYRIRINRILELEKIRTRISRDLHDDVGSTLSAINILSTSAKQLTHTDAGRTKDYLENINENAQRMLLNMNDIIWAIKPTEDTLEQLMQRMQSYAADVLEAKNVWYEIDFPEQLYDIKLTLDQKRNLFLIFKEAVNNMAKYAQCTQAKFSFTKAHGYLILMMTDNGKGFSISADDNLANILKGKSYLSGGNGLINMQRRADEINGDFKITSQPGVGTAISLKMKI